MTIKGKAYVAGVYEHPTRKADDPVAGAAARRGPRRARWRTQASRKDDVDGYFCAGDAPGLGRSRWRTTWGSSSATWTRRRRAARPTSSTSGTPREAIALGKCNVALITLAGRPRAEGVATGTRAAQRRSPPRRTRRSSIRTAPRWRTSTRWRAMRHMHQYGTTSEQLAWIKVAASQHAQHNPHALLREVVTVEDVLDSPMISDPLHRLDCCVHHRRRRRHRGRRARDRAEPEAPAR